NTNLRIALRMADEADSKDILGDKMAAHFDPGIPGRGAAKTGPGRIATFQAGYAGGWTTHEPERARIDIVEKDFGTGEQWPRPAHQGGRGPRAQRHRPCGGDRAGGRGERRRARPAQAVAVRAGRRLRPLAPAEPAHRRGAAAGRDGCPRGPGAADHLVLPGPGRE